MTKKKTTMIKRDPQKGNNVENPNSIDYEEDLLLVCHNETRGTDDLLYIDQHILKENRARQKNVAMMWINKKNYDMVPPTWILDSLKMYKISDKVIKFLTETMKN